MTGEQLALYGVITLIVVVYVRRRWVARAVPRYTPAEVAEMMKAGNVVLLDVRTAMERNGGSIKGSRHVPLHSLAHKTEELERFRDHEVICYCRSGNRSLSAAAKLRKRGFRAASMEGGIVAWNHL